MPPIIAEHAKDFIIKLLQKDPTNRLGKRPRHPVAVVITNKPTLNKFKLSCFVFNAGSGPTGALEIKSHPFFAGIDWLQLARKEIAAPFKPDIKHPLDTSNFSEEFTKLSVTDTPVEPPPNHDRLFRGKIFPFLQKL